MNNVQEELLLHLIENAEVKHLIIVTTLKLDVNGLSWKEKQHIVKEAYNDLLVLQKLGYISNLSDAAEEIIVYLTEKAMNYKN